LFISRGGKVLTDGVQSSLRFDHERTKVKQYFKLARALRTETTFNGTYDFDVGRRLGNRVLSLERVAQHCAISAHTVERIVLPR
jgi:phosphoenolpyruvate carboxylase